MTSDYHYCICYSLGGPADVNAREENLQNFRALETTHIPSLVITTIHDGPVIHVVTGWMTGVRTTGRVARIFLLATTMSKTTVSPSRDIDTFTDRRYISQRTLQVTA
jgi:hypothetical protein